MPHQSRRSSSIMTMVMTTVVWLIVLVHCSQPVESAPFCLTPAFESLKSTFRVQRPVFVCSRDVAKANFRDLQRPSRVVHHLPFEVAGTINLILCAIDFDSVELEVFMERNPQIGTSVPAFILGSQWNHTQLASFNVALDQEVYFFDQNAKILFEHYKVGGEAITREVLKVREGGKVMWSVIPSFFERRGNLHGHQLRIVSDNQRPYLMFDDDVVTSREPYLSPSGDAIYSGEDLELTGVFNDVFGILKSKLNFTHKIFIRQDRNWGILVNGTWNGMVSTVLKDEADLIFGSVTLNVLRSAVVDYLPPMAKETYGIAIKDVDREQLSWLSFLLPFSRDSWVALVINALFLLVVVETFEAITANKKAKLNKSLVDIAYQVGGDFWMLLCSYFGKKPPEEAQSRIKKKNTSQILIFTIFLAGNIVFMAYRASLTSELSTRRQRIPFDSLEGLIKTNYEVTTFSGAGLLVDSFGRAEEGTGLKQIHDNFFKDKSPMDRYPTIRAGLAGLLDQPYEAFISVVESIAYHQQFQCKILLAWKSKYPNFLSFAFPKRSPYFKFFNYKALQLIENGAIDVLTKRWVASMDNQQCRPQEPTGLSLEKLISLFGFLGTAAVLSGFIFLLESLGKVGSFQRSTSPDSPISGTSLTMKCWIRALPTKYGIDNQDAFLAEVEDLIGFARKNPMQRV